MSVSILDVQGHEINTFFQSVAVLLVNVTDVSEYVVVEASDTYIALPFTPEHEQKLVAVVELPMLIVEEAEADTWSAPPSTGEEAVVTLMLCAVSEDDVDETSDPLSADLTMLVNVEVLSVIEKEDVDKMSGCVEDMPEIVESSKTNALFWPVTPNKQTVAETDAENDTVFKVEVPPVTERRDCESVDGCEKMIVVRDKVPDEDMSVVERDVMANVSVLNEAVELIENEPPVTLIFRF